MSFEKKRGLSPVIATVLLISIALILAIIIFLWARSFIGEQIQKDEQNIENVCENVVFRAEAHDSTRELLIENIGTIAIYTVEIRVKGEGDISQVPSPAGGGTIGPGQTASFSLPTGVSTGQTIIAVPVLLGETATERVPKACDIDYGVEAEVLP